MRKYNLYLDTSAINFLFAEDAPEKQALTIELFDKFLHEDIYQVFVSEFVLAEIGQTKNESHKQRLLDVLNQYPITLMTLRDVEEVERLAKLYIENKILPTKNLIDAIHVAICVLERIDFLVSWNYKHLSNVHRERRILSMNVEYGYLHPIRIVTPFDLIDDHEIS